MFPKGAPGTIEDLSDKTEKYGIMCKEEALRMTHELARVRLPSERDVDYDSLIQNVHKMKELVKDEEIFSLLTQDFCHELLDIIQTMPYEKRQMFESSAIFDSFVNILIREL